MIQMTTEIQLIGVYFHCNYRSVHWMFASVKIYSSSTRKENDMLLVVNKFVTCSKKKFAPNKSVH